MADKVKKPTIDLSALSDISSVVTGMQSPDLNTKTGYFEIDTSKISEDPNQPRREFDAKALDELALSIEENGLKQPIAIRKDPEHSGRYIVCQGARRLRAYKLKGWRKIPAVFDPKFTKTGQVIENIQRQPLTPQELADYIKEELDAGRSIRQIAKNLGKSPAYVFLYKNLLDIKPEAVKKAWKSDRIKDIQVLNELMHLAKTHEKDVVKFVASIEDEITRPQVNALKKKLTDDVPTDGSKGRGEGTESGKTGTKKKQAAVFAFVEYQGEVAVLLLREAARNKVAIRLEGGDEVEVPIGEVSLIRVGSR